MIQGNWIKTQAINIKFNFLYYLQYLQSSYFIYRFISRAVCEAATDTHFTDLSIARIYILIMLVFLL